MDLSLGLPNKICDFCREKLLNFYSFRTQCLYNEQHYTQLLKKSPESLDIDPFNKETVLEPDTFSKTSWKISHSNSLAPEVILTTKHSLDNSDNELIKEEILFDDDESQMMAKDEDDETVVNLTEIENNSFVLPNTLQRETIKIAEFIPRKCCQCHYYTYKGIEDLQTHFCCEHPEIQYGIKDDNQVQCPLCFKTFDTKDDLIQNHFQHKKNRNTVKIQSCEKCNLTFQFKKEWRMHIESHEDHSFDCPDCGMKYKAFESFKSHCKKHQAVYDHLCTTCGKTFSTPSDLIRHQICHEEKAYQCDICYAKLARKFSLIRHMRTHTGKKLYVCEYCSRGYSNYIDWKDHISSRHTGTYAYQCDQCKKGFNQPKHYRDHIQKKPLLCTEKKQQIRRPRAKTMVIT